MLNAIAYIYVTTLSICGDCKAKDKVSLQICEHACKQALMWSYLSSEKVVVIETARKEERR